MRLRNLSTEKVPRELWHGAARMMGLGALLPQAGADDIGLYPRDGRLHVTVRPRRLNPRGLLVETGRYSSGKIRMSPCSRCSLAFLSEVFLHELFHAWLDQRNPSLYIDWDHCDVAERFARTGYRLLGGNRGSRDTCSGHRLRPHPSRRHWGDFRGLVDSLEHQTDRGLEGWHPVTGRIVCLQANNRMQRSVRPS